MYWNRSAADIAAAWQSEIDSRIETGATATLLAGAPDTVLGSANTLLALQENAIQRNDVTTPLLVIGGNSAVWLGLLLPPLPAGNHPHAPAPALVYGGADEATYVSVAALTLAALTPAALTRAEVQPLVATGAWRGVSPLELGFQVAPHLQPGTATPWELLPLVETGEQPATTTQHTTQHSALHSASDPTGDWIAWGVMLLAFCLVLTALLI